MIAAVVPDHDGKRIRKYSGNWPHGLRYADEASLALRAPSQRFISKSALR